MSPSHLSTPFIANKAGRWLSACFLIVLVCSCGQADNPADASDGVVSNASLSPIFRLLNAEESNVHFANNIAENQQMNYLTYEYFYNGGGVATGDVNGDGLPDVFFTGNLVANRLFLNKGNLQFEEATASSGIEGRSPGWSTGVTMADVNGDGWTDIYVCQSGNFEKPLRENLLYINQGDGSFTEQGAAFGLNDPSWSTQAAFLDYDLDGDLDVFLLNHSIQKHDNFIVEKMRYGHDPDAGDKFYRNDNGHFTDVSATAGIFDNSLGFGLSVTASDYNADGLPDLFVTNDFLEPDYLYINQGDGTFRESLSEYMSHTSNFSMGSDAADINNDGLVDLMVLDMLPEDNHRQKLLKGPANYDRYNMQVNSGYKHQVMRNCLQLNRGNGFSEIGVLAGVSNTDWSWSALLADYDLDGYPDLYVTNGYMRDFTNMDFLKYTYDDAVNKAREEGESFDLVALLETLPSVKLSNYMFRNNGHLQFENVGNAWGLGEQTFSNGAAYSDLDRDGDLDLIVNNINEKAFIYENISIGHSDGAAKTDRAHWLEVELSGMGANSAALGAKVELTMPDGSKMMREMYVNRGYQSSVEPLLHFGLGSEESISSLKVYWPGGTVSEMVNLTSDQLINIRQTGEEKPLPATRNSTSLLFRQLEAAEQPLYRHVENDFVDYRRERMLPHMLSRLGPALATADVNADGLDDIFVGGARGQSPVLYIGAEDGSFSASFESNWQTESRYEDVSALFFDADGDSDADLYVCSGGNALAEHHADYADRLYFNDGSGKFTSDTSALPFMTVSTAAVSAYDYDGDGDNDLFVGGRVRPGKYPLSPSSFLLENQGDGIFKDRTAQLAPELSRVGMLQTAIWTDTDADGKIEIALAGEWTAVRLFEWNGDRFVETTALAGLENSQGWWNDLQAADLNGDGAIDLIGGNRGQNGIIKATADQPATIYAGDFDQNGALDPILCYFIQGKSYPIASRDDMLAQLPHLRKTFIRYADYADATVSDFIPSETLDTVTRFTAVEFASGWFKNDGKGHFTFEPWPLEAQFAPVNAQIIFDVDADGRPDVLLGGNNYAVRPELGREDASEGLLLLNTGKGSFETVQGIQSGFHAWGDVRAMVLTGKDHPESSNHRVIIAENNGGLKWIKLEKPGIP